MKLSDHLPKALWSLADRGVFLSYGFMGLAQIAALPKEQWGVFSIYNELYEMLFTLSDGFVLQALVKFGVEPSRSKEVMATTFIAHTLLIGIAAGALFLLRGWLAHGFHEARLFEVLATLPLLCLLTIPRTYALKLFQMLIRTREIFVIDLAFFGTMAVMTIYRISTGTLISADAMIGINISGAIAGSVTGLLLAIPHARLRFAVSKPLLREIAPFGFFQGLAVSSVIAQQKIDGFMVQYFWSTSVTADYATAKRFLKLFDAARDAIGTIAYPAVARMQSQKRFADLKIMLEKMMSLTMFGMIVIVAFCEFGGIAFLFHLVFGDKYDSAIPVFNVLAIIGLLLPFTLNLTVLTGLGKSKTIFQVAVISSLVSIFGNWYLVPRYGSFGAAWAVVTAGVVTAILATRAVHAEIPFRFGSLFRGPRDAMSFFRRAERELPHND